MSPKYIVYCYFTSFFRIKNAHKMRKKKAQNETQLTTRGELSN